MVKSFEDLKKFIDVADAAVRTAEKGKTAYLKNKVAAETHLEEAARIIKEAVKEYKISSSDSPEILNTKIKAVLNGLKKAREQQLHLGKLRSNMQKYIDETLKDGITRAAQNVFGYRQFRTKTQNEMTGTKMEIAGSSLILKKFLIDHNESQSVIDKIDLFMKKLQQANFYEMTEDKKKEIVKTFSDAVDLHVGVTEKRKARKGLYTAYNEHLEELLNKAIEYTDNSKECWGHCQRLRAQLDNNKYVNEVLAELGVIEFEENTKLKLTEIDKLEERLKNRILREMPEGEGAEELKKIAAVKIPEEIDWLKKVYSLGNWVYENYGETIGEEIGLPKEAKFEFSLDLPSIDAEVGIPVFHVGFASLEVEFGVSVTPSVGVNGALTLHNFFSASENTIVSGNIAAEAKVEAAAFVGLALTLIEIIKASGRIVVSASVGVSMDANVQLNKANIEGYPSLDCKSTAGVEFVLSGHLEAVLGLTAALKTLIKAITGIKPELKLKTPSYDFFKASRTAEMTFELPVKKKPTSFPKDQFNMSSGQWEVTFIAQEQLTQFWNEKFGGLDKLNKIKAENALNPAEIKELHDLYSGFGIRTSGSSTN
jgi:hypothetical protein